MRIAWNEKEAKEGFRLSKQEAASSFGDDRMLVEKYIDSGRHIEVQVICDKHGNALYLNERECSVQRRNQKVVEEAPSFFVDPDMRKRMGEQACALAVAVGYDSAGTVEFLVDSQKNFYFLEMNTRLQVEHPITECITGVDIVQQMMRVAYGHKLNLTQKDIGIDGWAVECRVYAEDPFKSFGIPSIGRLSRYREPLHIPGVRCDSGIREGSEISMYYDPLICKLITYGKDRNQSLDRMRDALDNYVIRGPTHNIPLLRDIVVEDVFRSGMYDTKYLPQTYPDGFKGATLNKREEVDLAAFVATYSAVCEFEKHDQINRHARLETEAEPASEPHSFFITVPRQDDAADDSYLVTVTQHKDGTYNASVDGQDVPVTGKVDLAASVVDLKVGQHNFCAQVLSRTSGKLSLTYKGTPFHVNVMPADAEKYLKYMPEKKTLDLSNVTIAPMAGMVKSVAVAVGDVVGEGMELCVIEAMKMQNSLVSPRDGKVKAITCKAGETVEENAVLVELE
jgi:propionyl-CoA carboxylase alpha chain